LPGETNLSKFDEVSFVREKKIVPSIYEEFFEEFPGMRV
jgi:hypothetical protein